MKKLKQALVLGLTTTLLTSISFAAHKATYASNRDPLSKADQKVLTEPYKKEQKDDSASGPSTAKEGASQLEPADGANLGPSESGIQN